jgi:Helix-turn-helix domain
MTKYARPQVLVPWDVREALSVVEAAAIIGCSLVTVRNWASMHGLGRRVGGKWMLSRVALQMYLDGDRRALGAYLLGDRQSELVLPYFEKCGLLSAPISSANAEA